MLIGACLLRVFVCPLVCAYVLLQSHWQCWLLVGWCAGAGSSGKAAALHTRRASRAMSCRTMAMWRREGICLAGAHKAPPCVTWDFPRTGGEEDKDSTGRAVG